MTLLCSNHMISNAGQVYTYIQTKCKFVGHKDLIQSTRIFTTSNWLEFILKYGTLFVLIYICRCIPLNHSACLGFCYKVSKDQLFEDRDIPKVDKKKSKIARKEERERENFEVEEGLEVHPGDDHHPHHEGCQVDLCVSLELD